jgi:hypothetical protein
MRFNLRSAAVIAVCLMFTFRDATGWNSIGHMAG